MDQRPMTAFAYRAARPDGGRAEGVLRATSEGAAAAILRERGLMPIRLRPAGSAQAPRPIAPALLAPVFAGMAALLDSGVPADRVLRSLEAGTTGVVRDVLNAAREAIREGSGFAQAFQTGGRMPRHVIGLLQAGEAQGRLAAAARRVATELDRDAALRAQLRSVLAYPAFLAAAGLVSVTLIVGFVVPRFASLLTGLGRDPPATTMILLSVSRGVRSNALWGGTTLLVAGTIALTWLRTGPGRSWLHHFLLGIPAVGVLRFKLASARACRTLSALLDGGVGLLPSLGIAAGGCPDAAIQARLMQVRSAITEGETFAATAARHAALTPAAIQLARFGEETGRLAEFLDVAARNDDEAAHRALRTMVTLLEPLLIVCFGGVVAFVAAGLLQAVYGVRP